ncbi:TOBE domain-containing protein [Pseudomonas sp. GV071]|jgi:molybdate transport system regulatory protein|uniref:TOBE domain-containing protein n=1 Tax=Pseudomonas sp. GV071 TaxID=2135754 RepID=UPI000D3D9D4C|nr:TOBE domain-containing protein [Pseudomonas sp. GV071]PTQ72076.1 molybdate transport system regulatory protein [Pseudomonas sp. GV071]
MKLEGQFWITHNGNDVAGEGRIALLRAIDSTGSISQAAKAVGISYKFAWDSIDAMNGASGSPLVQRSAGGKGGGGTQLTEAGHALIAAYQRYQQEHALFLQRLGDAEDVSTLLEFMERLRMKTSARNLLFGTVVAIQNGEVNDLVEFQLNSGDRLTASITHDSTARLQLQPGVAMHALLKASWVQLVAVDYRSEEPSDNLLRGEVRQVTRGSAETEVSMELPGGATLVAVLSNAQADGLQLSVDKPAAALVKAAHMILGRF